MRVKPIKMSVSRAKLFLFNTAIMIKVLAVLLLSVENVILYV